VPLRVGPLAQALEAEAMEAGVGVSLVFCGDEPVAHWTFRHCAIMASKAAPEAGSSKQQRELLSGVTAAFV